MEVGVEVSFAINSFCKLIVFEELKVEIYKNLWQSSLNQRKREIS